MLPLAVIALAASGAGCPAPAVQTSDNPYLPAEFTHGSRWIAPSPRRLYAVMWSGRAVNGRFSVFAHGFNPVTGINEKIMWVVPNRTSARSGKRISVTWRRHGRTARVQRFGRSGDVPGTRRGRELWVPIYPSILRAPSQGCWKLRIRTGRIRTTMFVLVQPQPQA